MAESEGVLRDEIDFDHALGDEIFGFLDDIFDAARAVWTFDTRDGAESALAAASVGDFYVCARSHFRKHARGGGGGQEALWGAYAQSRSLTDDGISDVQYIAGSKEKVDFRDLGCELLGIPLCEATGDDEALASSYLFKARELENGVDGFFFGGFDEATGVDDEDIGIRGVFDGDKAAGGGVTKNDLGIHGVFGASEAGNVEGEHDGGNTMVVAGRRCKM